MDQARHQEAQQQFAEALREALAHLYDPGGLRQSTLLELCGNGADFGRLSDLLVRAIAALQPSSDVPSHAVAWRNYYVLTYRFVEQSTQIEVADDLGVSVRQLRRYEQAAVACLADALWREYGLAERVHQPSAPPTAEPADESPQGREQELAWVRQSFPRGASSPQDLVRSVLRIIGPLADEAEVRLTCQLREDLPPIVGQLAALRQALINLLTAAVRSAPKGVVQLSAHVANEGLALIVRAIAPAAPGVSEPQSTVEESLAMARQLADAFGAKLTVRLCGGEPEERLYARVTLSQARQAQVLFLDDNADALRLFERYLQDTRYRMLPLREPEQILDMASEAHPDAIVLDVMLPGTDGWELLGRLREHPATRRIPVLVCTILPQKELALALGAAAFIRKPVSREDLLAGLARVLP